MRDSVWAGPRSLAVTNGIAVCVLFLFLLRCFNSERSPLREAIARGFPFGDPQFFPSMQVPEAYRSLARPSSALEPSHSPAGTVARLMDVTLVTRITVGSSGRLDRTYIRCHNALVDARAFDPSHPRLRGMVHRSCVDQPSALDHLSRVVRVGRFGDPAWTRWDSNPGRPPCKGGALPLSYGPGPCGPGRKM